MGLSDHLDKLRAFRAIAETGKLSEAAARVNLSQPSLSRLVQTLEDAVGRPLLHRSRQGVAPTEAGKLLLAFAKTTLKGLEDLEEKLRHPGVERAGVLRVGSYESLAEYLWPDFVLKFRKAAPELKLSLRTNGDHPRALEDGELDILVDAEPRVRGDFTSWTLYEDRFGFHGASGKVPSSLTPEDAPAMTLIFSPVAFDGENKGILRHLEEKGYFFGEKVELDSFTAVRTFARTGLGLAVLPQRLAEDSNRKDLAPVALKGFPAKGFGSHSICATIRSSRTDDPRLRLLVKALRENFKA